MARAMDIVEERGRLNNFVQPILDNNSIIETAVTVNSATSIV